MFCKRKPRRAELADFAAELSRDIAATVADWPEEVQALGEQLETQADRLEAAVRVIEAADRNAGMREQLWPTIGLALGIEALLSRADAVKALEPDAYTRLETEAVLVRSFLRALAERLDAALFRSGPARQG